MNSHQEELFKVTKG